MHYTFEFVKSSPLSGSLIVHGERCRATFNISIHSKTLPITITNWELYSSGGTIQETEYGFARLIRESITIDLTEGETSNMFEILRINLLAIDPAEDDVE